MNGRRAGAEWQGHRYGRCMPATRRPVHPARRRLTVAVILVLVGSFLPWIYVAGMPVSGARGPGIWTAYAGILGIAAALMPWHRVGGGHAVVMAATCVGLPAWQLTAVIQRVGFGGWAPGPGLVMVAFGGIIAGQCAWRLLREPAPTD